MLPCPGEEWAERAICQMLGLGIEYLSEVSHVGGSSGEAEDLHLSMLNLDDTAMMMTILQSS